MGFIKDFEHEYTSFEGLQESEYGLYRYIRFDLQLIKGIVWYFVGVLCERVQIFHNM